MDFLNPAKQWVGNRCYRNLLARPDEELPAYVESNEYEEGEAQNMRPRRFPFYLLLYFLFIFYLHRCTLPDFSFVSFLANRTPPL